MAGQVIVAAYSVGPTLTGAATASCLPTYCVTTLPAGYWQVGRIWRIRCAGVVSTAATTPGVFRLDLRMAAITVFDTLALPGNTTIQTTVPWWGEILLTCRSVGSGTTASLFGQGLFTSTAWLNTPAVATGPWGATIPVPYNTAPVVGAGFDSTIANAIDFRFTQTAATGSFNLHTFVI